MVSEAQRTPAKPSASDRSVQVLGRYVLYDVIATGGMASVHIGRHVGPLGFCRTVAIKRLHAQYARNPEFVAMFLDEARLAARVNHPNVASMLDVVTAPNELCLVMEYLHGEDLSKLRARDGAAPTVEVSVAIILGALRGLHAAHIATDDAGSPLEVVHRDVSPQNIFVGLDGTIRVLDFGIAKATSRTQVTREGQVKGKLAYMSPEQIRSEPVDRRSDVFAAGVVLWELLTGERLFSRDDPGATIHDILMRERTPPSSLGPGIPPELDAIVLRALEVDPADRFSTAAEMAAALEGAQSPATPEEIAAWVSRHAGPSLTKRHQRVRAVERIPSDEVADEVTKADQALAASLRDALELLQQREARASLETAADVLSTHVDAVVPDAPAVASTPNAVRTAASAASTSEVVAPAQATSEVVAPTHATSAPTQRLWTGLLLIGIGVVLALLWSRGSTDAQPVAAPRSADATPRSADATPRSADAARADATPPPPEVTATPSVTTRSSAAAVATTPTASSNPRPPSQAVPRTRRPPARTQPSPPPRTANCTPNFYYEDGIKRYKPQCFP